MYICISLILNIIYMNPFTNTQLKNLYEELTQDLLQKPNYDIDDDVLHEFRSSTKSEIGITKESEIMGIYLSFGLNENEDSESYYDELFRYWSSFIIPLQNYLESLYSENTNNDACSFQIKFDTDHSNTSEESFWEITIEITDYLS